jgi:dephospho-CoA kinase
MNSERSSKASQSCFWDSVFDNSAIDRAKLASVTFNDPDKLKNNKIVHPAVRTHLLMVKAHSKWGDPAYESAILFESGHSQRFRLHNTAYHSLESRIARVLRWVAWSSFKSDKNAMDWQRSIESDFEIEKQ